MASKTTTETTQDGAVTSVAAKAVARHVRVTPMKARRVVDLVRGKQAVEALAILQFAPQTASDPVRKVLASAIANARVFADKHSLPFDERELVISTTRDRP